jgi:hypothetical protein
VQAVWDAVVFTTEARKHGSTEARRHGDTEKSKRDLAANGREEHELEGKRGRRRLTQRCADEAERLASSNWQFAKVGDFNRRGCKGRGKSLKHRGTEEGGIKPRICADERELFRWGQQCPGCVIFWTWNSVSRQTSETWCIRLDGWSARAE